MSAEEWLDDTDDDLEQWDKDIEGAQRRAAEVSRGIRNLYKRKEIGDVKTKTIVRLVTVKCGEQFKHVLHLPNGKFITRNCAATPEQQENRIQICSWCQYVAAGGGTGEFGKPRLAHEYFFIGTLGQVKKVPEKIKGEVTITDEIIWMHEPQCIAATPTIARAFYKWHKNPEYPPGAEGKITAYNFSIYKTEGETSKDVRYTVEYYNSEARPTHGFNDKNEKVEIDMAIAAKIRDEIEIECAPSSSAELQAILDASEGQPPVDNRGVEESDEPSQEPAAGPLAGHHDFEDGDETPASAPAPAAATAASAGEQF